MRPTRHGLGEGIDERSIVYTYGRGGLVREAHERGYILIAPRATERQVRASLTFSDRSDDDQAIAALEHASRHYSIDPDRAFLFGHSLGAIQALRTASREPDRFQAVSAVGLTAIIDPRRLQGTPVQILWGAKDPLDAPIEIFRFISRVAGVQKIEFDEIEDLGHILIVHFETGRSFEFFDRHDSARWH